MKAEATSTCQACGARVPVGIDFCPVCALRGAVDDARETSEFDVNPTRSSAASRFDHYELLTRDDGTPLELGHDAQKSEIPAVALTAYARAEDRREAIRAGFQNHLAKPVEPAQLEIVYSLANRGSRAQHPDLKLREL